MYKVGCRMYKAIFLDRDGVINEVLTKRVQFVNTPNEFYLLYGVGEAIKLFNDLHFKVFVVTNQGGVGLGYMKEKTLLEIHDKMKKDLKEYGAYIDDIIYCVHKPNGGCNCRKPKPQMLFNLAKKHRVDLSQSYMVGDRKPDIEAGMLAGTKTVLIGKRNETTLADFNFSDLKSFANWLNIHQKTMI